ncbi:MAG TPA: hypothetical protein VGA17_07115 [Nitrospiraceae bacterium]
MRYFHLALFTAGTLALAGLLLNAPAAEAKRRPVTEPDLRIVQVSMSSENYVPGQGMLDVAVEVELPSYLDGDVLLEVSTLISSPSKRFMRFLSARQPVSMPPPDGASRMTVTLSWDGADQHEQAVSQGQYTYEIKAKLLAVGEKGPRTLMLSWPKRGTIEVK